MPIIFATPSQIATLSTTSAAALRAKAIADGVKNGTYVGGGTAGDINIKSVDTKAGPVALTTALWYLRTGDSSYLAPLKTFIRATVKPPDTNQALNEFRGLFGIFAAVIQLKAAGAWTSADDNAPCPNHNGDTWLQFLLGGGSQSGPYHTRTVGSTSQLASSLRGLNPGVDKTANNWNTVAMATHLAYAVLVNNTSEIDHNIKRMKKYLGDQTTGLPNYQATGDYIASWDNWGTPAVQAGIGKPDAARPGLDGVVIDDICRGKTGYNAGAAYYGAAASGLTYPLEAADYLWAQAAMLINGGHNVRSWGAGGNAFDRMNARFARHRVADEPSLFDFTEAKASVYKGGRFIASQLSQTDYELSSAVATPGGTAGLSRSMPYGDWLAPTNKTSTWGVTAGSVVTPPPPDPDPEPDPDPTDPTPTDPTPSPVGVPKVASSTYVESASATTLTAPRPAGTVAGDQIIAFVAGPAQMAQVTPDVMENWWSWGAANGYEASALTGINIFIRSAVANEPTSYAFTSPGPASRMSLTVLRVTGASGLSLPRGGNGPTGASYPAPSLTTESANNLALHFMSVMSSTAGSTDIGTPSGLTRVTGPVGATGQGGRRAAVFSEVRPTAGPIGIRSWSIVGTPVQWASVSLAAIPAANTGPPAHSGALGLVGRGGLSLSGRTALNPTVQSGSINLSGSTALQLSAATPAMRGSLSRSAVTGSLKVSPTILGTLELGGEGTEGSLALLGTTSFARYVWRAVAPIYLGDGSGITRAYNNGDIVPDSLVASNGLEYAGLVIRVNVLGATPTTAPTREVISSTLQRIEFMPASAYDALITETPATLYITY